MRPTATVDTKNPSKFSVSASEMLILHESVTEQQFGNAAYQPGPITNRGKDSGRVEFLSRVFHGASSALALIVPLVRSV